MDSELLFLIYYLASRAIGLFLILLHARNVGNPNGSTMNYMFAALYLLFPGIGEFAALGYGFYLLLKRAMNKDA